MPDANGNVIPSRIVEGSAAFESPEPGKRMNLAIAGGTFNVADATCHLICINCCAVTLAILPLDPFCPVGQTLNCSVQGTDCNGTVSAVAATAWSSNKTSVATVNSSGVVTGVAPGQFTLTATIHPVEIHTGQICLLFPVCNTIPVVSANMTVQVPTSLKVLSMNVLTTGGSSLPDHGCVPGFDYGISVDINYQVLDQQSPSQVIQNATMVPHEHLVWANGTVNDNDIGPTRISTTSHTTASDGTFHDAPVQMCSALPSTTDSNTQTISIILSGKSYTVRTQKISFSATTLPGHGTVKNDLGDINKTR